jgi:hypothetical protein
MIHILHIKKLKLKNACVHQNSKVEALIPEEMVMGDAVLGEC